MGKIMRKMLFSTALVGLGIYIAKSNKINNQVSSKVNGVLDNVSGKTHDMQDTFLTRVNSLAETLNEKVNSYVDVMDTTVKRLEHAFSSGKDAAKERLGSNDIESSSIIIPGRENKEPSLGATEDTSPGNVSPDLHPRSGNIGSNIGDSHTKMGTSYSKVNSFGSDSEINRG